MSRQTVTARGRVEALAGMLDACTVKRVTAPTVDPDTGNYNALSYTTIYTGACKVQQSAPASGATVVGQAEVFVGQMALHLPVTATTALVAPDDLVTITACNLDASLAGATFALRGPAHKSFATARRFPMVEVVG